MQYFSENLTKPNFLFKISENFAKLAKILLQQQTEPQLLFGCCQQQAERLAVERVNQSRNAEQRKMEGKLSEVGYPRKLTMLILGSRMD